MVLSMTKSKQIFLPVIDNHHEYEDRAPCLGLSCIKPGCKFAKASGSYDEVFFSTNSFSHVKKAEHKLTRCRS